MTSPDADTDPGICSACEDPISPREPATEIVAAGGWCAPSETYATLYSSPPPPLCTDCRSRLIFISEIGFDPGRKGENISVRRGGIQYPLPGSDADG